MQRAYPIWVSIYPNWGAAIENETRLRTWSPSRLDPASDQRDRGHRMKAGGCRAQRADRIEHDRGWGDIAMESAADHQIDGWIPFDKDVITRLGLADRGAKDQRDHIARARPGPRFLMHTAHGARRDRTEATAHSALCDH